MCERMQSGFLTLGIPVLKARNFGFQFGNSALKLCPPKPQWLERRSRPASGRLGESSQLFIRHNEGRVHAALGTAHGATAMHPRLF